jgi:hypothetical protein
MSGILGALGIQEAAAERTLIQTVGQQIVYEAVQAELEKYNNELNSILGLFLEGRTSDFKRRYELAGGGYLQPLGTQGQPAAVKATGHWDVAFPLSDYGAQFSRDRVGFAYMTVAQLNKHLDTIKIQDVNTVRREIMRALLDDNSGSAITFADPIHGSLSVQPLANGDATVYPAVLGSDTEAVEDHYLNSGYTVANISDSNNPCITVRDELEEHFGTPTGGSNIVMLCTTAIADKIEALSDFDPVTQRFIQPGDNADKVVGVPAGTPGRVRGICDGVWVVEWRSLPATYLMAVHADAPKPLMMREDPADTGLAGGLRLIAQDEEFPFNNAFYSHRFGFGVGNRLNGVCMEVSADGAYTTPTGFGH